MMKKRVNPKNIKRGVLGVYTRKLFFFVVLGVIVATGLIFLKYNTYKADTNFNVLLSKTDTNPNVLIEIKDNGLVYVDGKNTNRHLNIVGGFDELRMPIIDKPGGYLTDLKVTLKLPKGAAYQTEREILAIHGVNIAYATVIDQNTISYEAQGISPYATVSIVAKLPEGIIDRPFYVSAIDKMTQIQFNYWVVLAAALPFFTIIYMVMFLAYQGRVQHVDIPDKAINYPPMAIPPALVGALFHQKVGPREISATLVDLARRRDIVILDRERSFAFGKGKFDQRLLGYEKILLSKIFQENMTSDRREIERRISNHLYSKKISIVSASIYSVATRLGYFRINPQKVHAKYRLIGVLAFLIGAGGFFASFMLDFIPKFTAFFWIGMIFSALIIALTAGRIPLRSQLGNEALTNWLAFRKFLSDPTPIEYTTDLQAIFEAYLAYAIVLDCEAAWARRFEPHSFIVPNWFLTDKVGLGLEDFCLSLFPIISFVGRNFAALREPGFE